MNTSSPGGCRKEEWFSDIADIMLETHPENEKRIIIEIKRKIIEDILHSHGIIHGRIVSSLTCVRDIWFVEDDAFEKVIDRLAGF